MTTHQPFIEKQLLKHERVLNSKNISHPKTHCRPKPLPGERLRSPSQVTDQGPSNPNSTFQLLKTNVCCSRILEAVLCQID